MYAHRMVWTLDRGPVPHAHEVIHRCGNLACCNPRHLVAGPASVRGALMVAHGHSIAGAKHHAAKMTPETVRELLDRKRAQPELTGADLAARFGLLSVGAVTRILSGRAWRSVDVERVTLSKGPRPGVTRR